MVPNPLNDRSQGNGKGVYKNRLLCIMFRNDRLETRFKQCQCLPLEIFGKILVMDFLRASSSCSSADCRVDTKKIRKQAGKISFLLQTQEAMKISNISGDSLNFYLCLCFSLH
ncbi:hypothetical protein CEXT_145571 [Caerostris extrusa]|uniref:Uncharacterized protein n=1 Tax=Caerostris extrusa TaxID=172846 RepID=A0AAV4TU29_CAEEX|nr:hypothetical protein CEXT_145571 [Caerostris extrusa]